MASSIKAVRGTRDLLPPETELWNHVEKTARAVFERYGFGEIRTPLFEETSLFARGVGEETDIVSKEMYTWEDGERFSEPKITRAWREAHQNDVDIVHEELTFPGLAGPRIDLVVYRRSTNTIEFVDFKPKASAEHIQRINLNISIARNADPTNYQGKRVIARLVVPAGKGRVPGSLVNDSVIEEIVGDVFDSSQSLTLRPENTAGVVRAYIEHKLGDTGNLQKLFYIGPMFRRERPQRGRYRQFWQIGAEVIGPATSGSESAIRDAEVLEMLASMLDALGITGWTLSVNSVGSSTDRPRYIAALKEALAPIKDRLSPDNQRRAETNPLRVLDSKDEGDQELIDALPKIADYLDEASTEHFRQVLAALDACGVPYTVNPRLVRGLDYYTRTTFEFSHSVGLGSQNALLGGGRYDGLSEMLGGPRAPGIGFAIGEDRLILTLQAQAEAATAKKLDAFIAPMGVERNAAALALARELRRAGLSVDVGDGAFRLKKSFEVADKIARKIVILGEDEVASQVYTVKNFATSEQAKVAKAALVEALRA